MTNPGQYDNWTRWFVSRPFEDVRGARDWLRERIENLRESGWDVATARWAFGASAVPAHEYRGFMRNQQSLVGETIVINFRGTGLCYLWSAMGLEIFSFFYHDYPEVLTNYLEIATEHEVKRIHAVADRELSPVFIIPEDVSSKTGPIFSPSFLEQFHYPYMTRLVQAWHDHDVNVLYHTDGNYHALIPDLIKCGFDGFYCLEPAAGMDIIELKNTWPEMVWAGGVDGVDLMERGTPEQVGAEVRRQIIETNALRTGGMFVASSSEINPPIKPENFQAMVEAVGESYNPDFTS